MAVSLIGVSLLCIAAVLIGAGVRAPLREGVWPIVQVLPLLALPLGFLLLVALLITTAVRRRRSAPDAGR